jgi:hypothetical protein
MFVVFPWPWGVKTFKNWLSMPISALAPKKLKEISWKSGIR